MIFRIYVYVFLLFSCLLHYATQVDLKFNCKLKIVFQQLKLVCISTHFVDFLNLNFFTQKDNLYKDLRGTQGDPNVTVITESHNSHTAIRSWSKQCAGNKGPPEWRIRKVGAPKGCRSLLRNGATTQSEALLERNERMRSSAAGGQGARASLTRTRLVGEH